MYNFNNFVAELEDAVKNCSSYDEIIDSSARSMSRLLENHSLISDEQILKLLQGKEDNTVYHSPENRFIVQIFVWEPGSQTPVHDHHTWGIMGIYRNALQVTEYELTPLNSNEYDLNETDTFYAKYGTVCSVVPPGNEIHKISNPTDQVSVSIHVYGKEIDEYNIYDLENNCIKHRIVG